MRTYNGIEGFREFASFVGMTREELVDRERALRDSFMPFKVTEYYAQLIASQEELAKAQLLNIVTPPPGSKKFSGRFDPYGNKLYRQQEYPFLQHKYEKTLLLHIDDFCISNCQFCYKVNEIRVEGTSSASWMSKIEVACRYLEEHKEVDNVLFTGGDPAAFRKTSDLLALFDRLLSVKTLRVVRFATKGLAYDPERFLDEELLSYFDRVNRMEGRQVSVIAQINHPAEMSEVACRAVSELQRVRVQLRGQPALVRGVNDSADTLVELQRKFLDQQIISYYFTVFMPVKGVEQYGIPLDEAFRQMAESKRRLSGLEKKGVLLSSHDFGKLEICGFYPTPEDPHKIVLKWHEAAMEHHLPRSLRDRVPTRPEDILVLDYKIDTMFCVDHVFAANELPYFTPEGVLIEPHSLRAAG